MAVLISINPDIPRAASPTMDIRHSMTRPLRLTFQYVVKLLCFGGLSIFHIPQTCVGNQNNMDHMDGRYGLVGIDGRFTAKSGNCTF